MDQESVVLVDVEGTGDINDFFRIKDVLIIEIAVILKCGLPARAVSLHLLKWGNDYIIEDGWFALFHGDLVACVLRDLHITAK